MTISAHPIDFAPISPQRNTLKLCAIVAGIAAIGLASQSANPGAAAAPTAQMSVYGSLILGELALLRFVQHSLKKNGNSIVSLLGIRRTGLADIGLAVLLFVLWLAVEHGLGLMIGDGSQRLTDRLVPHSAIELTLFIPLSLCAGVIEEIVFRGFLQRQFAALFGNQTAAIVLQAVIFGVAHLYQGTIPVIHIVVFGLIFGTAAAWRRSLIPGIIAHAAVDLLNVLSVLG
jgi:membrane protease YdiL (CAAX protease family)